MASLIRALPRAGGDRTPAARHLGISRMALLVLVCPWGCSSPTGPSAAPSGTWQATNQVPGSGLTMTLTQSGNELFGSGTYRIEADGGGGLAVTGTFNDPALSLTLVYDNGRRATYTGTLTSGNEIRGRITYAGFGPSALDFLRVLATPDAGSQVVPGRSDGPAQIIFVAASIPPGSTIFGCGAQISGCTGKLGMTFSVRSDLAGPVLGMAVFLHDKERKIACLTATVPSFDLPAGQAILVSVVFDKADVCATPLTIGDMDAVLNAPVQTSGRQEWGLTYLFTP